MYNNVKIKIIGCSGALLILFGAIYSKYLDVVGIGLGIILVEISLEMFLNNRKDKKAIRRTKERIIDVILFVLVIGMKVLNAPISIFYFILVFLTFKLIWDTIMRNNHTANEEIERKFLVDLNILYDTVDLSRYKKYSIEQAYLSVEENEIRIRKITNSFKLISCFMTIKSNGNLVRNEIEFKIKNSKYFNLIDSKMYSGGILNKERYRIAIQNDLIAEFDKYYGNLYGLLLVEVEFSSKEEAKAFMKPEWFGKEVTNDANYKNRNLAINPADITIAKSAIERDK